ncbi:probable carboxylesterase 15 [Diospyros lotus]|uniref:probable carboxylesterase 15 n=1 Tax=Diospyros lotus TaxID=55363 RepID=UPI002252DBF3|nr:probable carboxylesterase 15 [Diospyros lotus]
MSLGKRIVTEVSGCLRVFDDGTVDRTWTGPPEMEFMTKSVPPHEEFIDGVATRDVVIDSTSGRMVRIYIPQNEENIAGKDKLPLLLHFHGGGFCFSRPQWYLYYNFYARLVLSARAVCVSVDLRLAPEHRVPAACDDAYSAFLWLDAVARGELSEPWLETYADFGRVFLVGDSTGGNLVHETASRAGEIDAGALKLVGGIPLHPGFIREEPSRSLLELPESPMLTRDMVTKLMDLGLPEGCTKDHPVTCPMGPSAPPLSLLKLPPMLVVVAEKDLLRDTELEYCEAMKKAGKEVEVLLEEGMSHCYYLNKIAVDVEPEAAASADRLIAAIINFINRG